MLFPLTPTELLFLVTLVTTLMILALMVFLSRDRICKTLSVAGFFLVIVYLLFSSWSNPLWDLLPVDFADILLLNIIPLFPSILLSIGIAICAATVAHKHNLTLKLLAFILVGLSILLLATLSAHCIGIDLGGGFGVLDGRCVLGAT